MYKVIGSVLILMALACASSENSDSFAIGLPPPQTPQRINVNAPATANELLPLSSVADLTDQVMPSVVHITAGNSGGTGFIISKDGAVVTNHHVIQGYEQVTIHLTTGTVYQGRVSSTDPTMDIAHLTIMDTDQSFIPIAVGDSDSIRVGDEVMVIGFPLGWVLGTDPTVSTGIISAKRESLLQTDAPLNPGNSGGPLVDMSGQAVGVVAARVERDQSGNPVAGISFAIPINDVRERLQGDVALAVEGTPTPFPTIGQAPDIVATKDAIEALDANRRRVAEATRTAVEAEQEAVRYAASLEATRIAELPTATPRPTPTPLPTPTPHPRIHCQEWEALVLEWIKEGNIYFKASHFTNPSIHGQQDAEPSHPQLLASEARKWCITDFPYGVLTSKGSAYAGIPIGYEPGHLLPGTYEYRRAGDNRVEKDGCSLWLWKSGATRETVQMPYGEPFTFQFHENQGEVGSIWWCDGSLHRIGD